MNVIGRLYVLGAGALAVVAGLWVVSGSALSDASSEPIPVSARENPSSYRPVHVVGGWSAPSSGSGGYSTGK